VLWKDSYPKLNNGLELYDKIEFSPLPNSSLFPLRESKDRCREQLDEILDQLLVVLGVCGAADLRGQIRDCEEEIAAAKARIGENQRRLISAPPENSQGPLDGILTTSREHRQEDITADQEKIARNTEQIESLKEGFREHLKQIGLIFTSQEADSYLLDFEDDIVAMAAVINNIGRLTDQLQTLVDQSREAHEETLRYYGSYVLLVLAVDRIENHFIARVDTELLPRLRQIEQDAHQHIDGAKMQIKRGGPLEILSGNIAANKASIKGCQDLAALLQSQRRSIGERNRETRMILDAAINTYKTARTSGDLALLIGKCHADFQALRELRLPPLRAFQNMQLNEEMRHLAARVAKKE
jgi:hypothetical protein